ncbi:MAG: hypothetical protein ACKOF9_04280 [Burkholderiales bacterium]
MAKETFSFEEAVAPTSKTFSFDEAVGKAAAPATSWTDNFRDPLAAGLKIGPTAVKGVADIARLLTGDRVGVDTSNAMKTGMQSIDEMVGSDALRAQKAAVDRALQDKAIGLTDLPGILLDNPRASADAAVSTIGSMFLPTGVAIGATKALPLAARLVPALARIAPTAVATGAAVGTGAAQNAAETFADTEGQDMSDRYTGAGISGAASLLLGRLLGAGAEGVVARRMIGENVTRGVMAAGKSAAKTGAKEFGQEFGEESSNYVGKQVAKNEEIDPNTMGKQGLYGGILGFGAGGASDVATRLGNISGRAPQTQPDPQPTAPPAPQPAPTKAMPSDVVQRILGAIEQTQNPNVQDPAQRTAQPQTKTTAPAVEAPAPEASNGAAATGVPAELAAPSVEAAGLKPFAEPDAAIDAAQADLQSAQAPQQIPQPSEPTQAAPAVQQPVQQQPGPIRLGMDNQPLTEGGKPFKTQQAASNAKKLQPAMRVVKVQGGFALADKTPAQLAAQAKAAKRLGGVGGSGPLSAHAFIAAHGGLSRSVASDLGIEGNVRVGSRWLYANNGGMTIEQATQKLLEAGYIGRDQHNDAYDIIRRSVSDPQYTPKGWEQIAQAENQAQFEDYLAAQAEGDASLMLDAAELADMQSDGHAYDEAAQANLTALIEAANNEGIDTEALLEEAARITENGTHDDYTREATRRVAQARNAATGSGEPVAREGLEQGRQAAGRQGGEGGGAGVGRESDAGDSGQTEALTSYTPQEVTQRIERLEQAEKERKAAQAKADQDEARQRERAEVKRRSEAAADTFELGQDPMENLTGQGGLFDSALDARLFFVGTRYDKGEPGNKNTAVQDAVEVLGFDFVPVVINQRNVNQPDTPMQYSTGREVILYNTAVQRSRAADVQYMIEEILHAVDSVGGRNTISASSRRLQPGGDLRQELEAAYKKSAAMRDILSHPLAEPEMTQTEVAAELYARSGMIYHSKPQLLKLVAPRTYDAHHAAFSGQRNQSQVSGDVRGLPDSGVQAGQHVGGGGRIHGRFAGGNSDRHADGLRRLRQGIADAFAGDIEGAPVTFHDAGDLLSAKKSSGGDTARPNPDPVSVAAQDGRSAADAQRVAESLPNLNQDIVLEIPVEGGKTARLTINAQAYLNQLDAREQALRMVKECMT